MSAPALAAAPAGGFADPVRDAAFAFRALLDATAQPGRVFALGAGVLAPPPLSPAAAAALLTLADADAPVWLAPSLRAPAVEGWLRFHLSTAPEAEPSRAAYAVGRWDDIAGLDWPVGSAEHPDRSVTLIVEVEALREGAGARISGPGVAGARRLAVDGVGSGFWAARAANRALFPLGWDAILTAGATVAALPRATRAEL
ncbi:MAG: phosphonate C-P lyase system protein PhnH [Rubrimonas sp.]|uniref:phosphonate C-P lyase system protein PhnH n=1 Tax=Rubrimonas sp. TaxID=2036015 RepID=UPI002FDC9D16